LLIIINCIISLSNFEISNKISQVDRLKFDLNGAWRISHVNSEFKLCPSYPRLFLVPSSISDDVLQNVASFRSSRRIPVVVWR